MNETQCNKRKRALISASKTAAFSKTLPWTEIFAPLIVVRLRNFNILFQQPKKGRKQSNELQFSSED